MLAAFAIATLLLAKVPSAHFVPPQASVQDRTADEAAIRAGATAWADAFIIGDVGVVDSLLADDFVGMSKSGELYDKPTMLGWVREGPNVTSNVTTVHQVRFFGEIAIATGSDAMVGAPPELKPIKSIWTDIWGLRDGQWRVIAAQDMAGVPDMAAAPTQKAIPLGSTYDANNPFARIIAGSVPSVVVAETDTALAFMDYRPARTGHVLVIPKSATVSLLDATPDQLAGVMAVVRCVAVAQTAAFRSDGMTGLSLRQNNGAPSQHIGHIHFHLIPTYGDQPIASPDASTPLDELEPVAARIRSAMPEGC